MSSQLDSRINAFVVELLDQPPQAPPFPADATLGAMTPRPRKTRRFVVALAAFVVVLLAGTLAVFLSLPRDSSLPLADATPTEIAEALAAEVNSSDLDGALRRFGPEAECLIPGLPTCEELFGFFIAADAVMALSDCEPLIGELFVCHGYMHTSVHTALGISEAQIRQLGNLNPTMAFDAGRITQFTINDPFTGDPDIDGAFWGYLLEIGAPFVSEDGVPLFSPDIVVPLTEAAVQFIEQGGN